jgi:hypothetical protein
MATDRAEQSRRGQSAPKTTTKHPYAAIEHRVIDSPAFADLKPTAQALLVLLARQLTKDNNGHLQASFKWCNRFGIGSEHTLRTAIAELIAHGFIFRTRCHGANGAWAKYAVTWLPIKQRDGLFLTNFVSCAWREWLPTKKKSTPQKLLDSSGIKCSFTPEHPAETAGTRGAKTADYELIPCRAVKGPLLRACINHSPRHRTPTNPIWPQRKIGRYLLEKWVTPQMPKAKAA